jgi:small subunit ribosomal protein S1
MKLKLVLIDAQDTHELPPPLRYFITEGHIDRWVYSPPSCGKVIETVFE